VCHNVHMKTITIRELHLETGRWVRYAASKEPLVVTDRGRRVVALRRFEQSMVGRPLPDREARIRRRPRIDVDSARYLEEMRDRG
jgi:antitoxin (DNA-binding transcriptional repressor) of toxin-antitoxin stability system